MSLNSLLINVLMVSTAITCVPAHATPPFGFFNGLSEPFKSKGKNYRSPIVGAEEQQTREIRFHGNYGPQESQFPCVNHNGLKEDDKPQDAVAALIQRLFPSPLHDVLIPNNIK